MDKVKTNLMVFIRPRILRDGVDAAIETNAKYNYVRDQQLERNKGKVPLMPSERQPTLPELGTLVAPQYLDPVRQLPAPGETVAPAPEPAPPPVTPTTPFGMSTTTPPEAGTQP